MNYYNEFDPKAAQWLRELMKEGLIPQGYVDTRSITYVLPGDLDGYTQCHFFAGIGGWPLALSLAGIPSDFQVWTGSCPCQPFSAAGKRKGTADERHLWPQFLRLISERKPAIVFGEQVASADGRQWLSGVRADLEELGYEVGAADLCAASVGAPHIRQRLFWGGWLANANHTGPQGRRRQELRECPDERIAGQSCNAGGLADAGRERRTGEPILLRPETTGRDDGGVSEATRGGTVGGLADAKHPERGKIGFDGQDEFHGEDSGREETHSVTGARSEVFWSRCVAIPCRDGKARRVEPTIFPLAHGLPGRVGLLRGAGNAIVPQVAAEFVRAFVEAAQAMKHNVPSYRIGGSL